MKIEITKEMLLYRECATSIWNKYGSPSEVLSDFWDKLHIYHDTCVDLFSLIILYPLDLWDVAEKSPSYAAEPKPLFFMHVVPQNQPTRFDIAFEKGGRAGFKVAPEQVSADDMEFCFIDFFDYDVFAEFKFEYYLVYINRSNKYPELTGFRALLRVDECKVYGNNRDVE